MTAGDPISMHTNIPPGGFLEIRPVVDVVWMVKNLYFGAGWKLYRVSSEGNNIAGIGSEQGMMSNRTMITTNQIFLSIQNTSTAPACFGFDGLVIK